MSSTHLNAPYRGRMLALRTLTTALLLACGRRRGVFAFGSAQFYGSTGSFIIESRAVGGIIATPDGFLRLQPLCYCRDGRTLEVRRRSHL